MVFPSQRSVTADCCDAFSARSTLSGSLGRNLSDHRDSVSSRKSSWADPIMLAGKLRGGSPWLHFRRRRQQQHARTATPPLFRNSQPKGTGPFRNPGCALRLPWPRTGSRTTLPSGRSLTDHPSYALHRCIDARSDGPGVDHDDRRSSNSPPSLCSGSTASEYRLYVVPS